MPAAPFTPAPPAVRAALMPLRKSQQLAESKERARLATMRKQNPERARRREERQRQLQYEVAQLLDHPLPPQTQASVAVARLFSHPRGTDAVLPELQALPELGRRILKFEIWQQIARHDDGTPKDAKRPARDLRRAVARNEPLLRALFGRDYGNLARLADKLMSRAEQGEPVDRDAGIAKQIAQLFPRPALD